MAHGTWFQPRLFLQLRLLWLWCFLAPEFVISIQLDCSHSDSIDIYTFYICTGTEFETMVQSNSNILKHSMEDDNTASETNTACKTSHENKLNGVEKYNKSSTIAPNTTSKRSAENQPLGVGKHDKPLNTAPNITSNTSAESQSNEMEKHNRSLKTASITFMLDRNQMIKSFEEKAQYYLKMSPEERRITNIFQTLLTSIDKYLVSQPVVSGEDGTDSITFASWALNYTERMVSVIAKDLLPGTNRTIRAGKLLMHAIKIDTAAGQSAKFQGSPVASQDELQDVFEIPFRNIQSLGAYVPAGFVVSEILRDWMQPVNTSWTRVSTRVVSALLEGLSDDLAEPVRFTLAHLDYPNTLGTSPRCSFWQPADAQWLASGCGVEWTNRTHTSCQCRHLTSFAVLVSVATHNQDDQSIQSIITKVLLSLSVVALLLSFVTFVAFKSLADDRNTIHINLALTLGSGQLLFLTLCGVIAGFLHFLFLSAFCWMLMEGLEIYLKLVVVFEFGFSWVPVYFATGYGVPTVIVAVSAGVNHKGYGTERMCWLSMEKGFHWSFAGPMIVILIFNTAILCLTVRIIHHHMSMGSHLERFEAVFGMVRGCVSLSVLLGTGWVFGVFQIGAAKVVMAYIFIIINGAQGLFIFGFHCLWNVRVRKEYLRVLVARNLVSAECINWQSPSEVNKSSLQMLKHTSDKGSSLGTAMNNYERTLSTPSGSA